MSIDGDFGNVDDARTRIFKALKEQFRQVGFVVFDERFEPKPAVPGNRQQWGGYLIAFKLIHQDEYERLGGELENIRRNALTTGQGNSVRSESS